MNAHACVVTGAAMGIGQAIAVCLRREGWEVVGVDVDADRLASVADELGLHAVVGDIAEQDTHDRAADLAAVVGTLAGWVNNAGIDVQGAAHEVDRDGLERALGVLLVGPMLGTATAVRRLCAAGTAGSIVNVGSIQGSVAFPGYFAYGAAKAGVAALARSVAVDYGHRGVRCNTVLPGAIETPMTYAGLPPAGPARDAELATHGRLAPLGRIGQPDEIANVVEFLLSTRSSYLSGQSIAVDGAATARCFPYPAVEADDTA